MPSPLFPSNYTRYEALFEVLDLMIESTLHAMERTKQFQGFGMQPPQLNRFLPREHFASKSKQKLTIPSKNM